MRNYLILMSATALAACGGDTGPVAVGGGAAPPAPGGNGGTPTPTAHSFVNPTETKTYQAHGGVQSYDYDYVETVHYDKIPATDSSGNPQVDANGNPLYAIDPNSRTLLDTGQPRQLYTANASTVRNPGVTVSYDPRNAQFTLQIAQNGNAANITFQDPAHRTNFTGNKTPQLGVPNLETGPVDQRLAKGVQYLEVDTGSDADTYDVSTFFYEKPGTTTKYVTYAGFVRNRFEAAAEVVLADAPRSQITQLTRPTSLERATFVFGEQTANSNVPQSGSANFSGNMTASMVNTPQIDNNPMQPSYFQWLSGTAGISVNFSSGAVTAALAGTTLAPMFDPSPIKDPTDTTGYTYPGVAIPAGASFTANGTAQIDLVGKGGFAGLFSSAQFLNGGTTQTVTIAGSTLDGAFYGPNGEEVGGTFRIVGGVPDQRVDIIGAFTATKGN